MKQDTKEAEKIKELLKEAQDHPLMKQIIAEKEAAILATRTEAAKKIESAKKEREEVIPKLQADLEAKEAKYKSAKEVLDGAGGEFQKARAALSGESYQFDIAIRQHEAVLYETADPRIDKAITFFRDRFEGLRVKDINAQQRTGETNLYAETKEIFTYSNVAAIKNALACCRAAIDELEQMKLTPDMNAERIEALQKGIPDADELTKYTGGKPLPGSRDFNPLHLLKSDDQLSWEIGKIAEKFKKVMRR
ncbi:MAG: hypothetical protein C0392_04935 [Syntrophus sp. (in: bacteria)]|nr:hypothetical protein [Syntrophus sp. (in: bacteria)]